MALSMDVNHLTETLSTSLMPNEDIDLAAYLEVYQELHTFCTLMGTLFGFVAKEIYEKTNTLNELRINDAHNYKTMWSMVEYETEGEILKKHDSGTRTLLRLHWGMAFMMTFLNRVQDMNMDDSTTSAGLSAYNDALAPHHSWFIRQAAKLAMYGLPTKGVILSRVCPKNVEECLIKFPHTLQLMKSVHDRVQNYYASSNLLDLP